MRWILIPALTLALVAPLAAQPGPDGMRGAGFGPRAMNGRGGGPNFDPAMMEEHLQARAEQIAKALNLTTEQRAAFDKLRQDRLATARTQMDQMRQLGDDLRTLLANPSPDPAAVGTKVIALDQMRTQLRDQRKRFEDAFSKILTPEQQFAFQAILDMRPGPGMGRGARQGGHGMHGGYGMRDGSGPRHFGSAPPPPGRNN